MAIQDWGKYLYRLKNVTIQTYSKRIRNDQLLSRSMRKGSISLGAHKLECNGAPSAFSLWTPWRLILQVTKSSSPAMLHPCLRDRGEEVSTAETGREEEEEDMPSGHPDLSPTSLEAL